MTPEERRARYRARARRHASCGVRTDGAVPAGCLRCWSVDAYHARRELYLDAVEQSDRQNERVEPIRPVVTFGWWLREAQQFPEH